MKNFLNIIFICIFLIYGISEVKAQCKAQNSPKRMICYFASWAGGRASPANIQPEDVDPCLCTHVLYAFVPVSNNVVSPSWSDESLFKRMVAWKNVNPNIKISMSVGGWNAQV